MLIIMLLMVGCSRSPQALPQPVASDTGLSTPATTQQPEATTAPTDTVPPNPTTAPSDTPQPTHTPEPSATAELTATSESSATLEPTTAQTVPATESGTPVEAVQATAQPPSAGVKFQIQNHTNRTIYVFGYDMDRSIPAGLIIYFQAPDWGAISLKICHKGKDDSLSCYIYNGTITESNPRVLISR